LDKKEFHRVFNDYYKVLCRFAYILVKSKETADEIVQSTLLTFWENRYSVQVNKDIKAYLFTSVKNAAINYLKSDTTRKKHEQEFALQSHSCESFSVNEDFFRVKLKEAITQLPEKCRVVYCLKYIEGLSYKEIAQYLEISTNTVDNHIQKALKILKEELNKYKPEFYNN
jgi:RNA polymerase sigma-70 factor, ECF subfamily